MKRIGLFTQLKLARFSKSECGSILVLWIMSLVAIIGIVALVFDMGRIKSHMAIYSGLRIAWLWPPLPNLMGKTTV